MAMNQDPLLEVVDLRTHFVSSEGTVPAVDGVNLTVGRNRTVCVVGESGCGKSVTARSVLRLVDPPGRHVGGEIRWASPSAKSGSGNGDRVIDLAGLDPRGEAMRRIRGNEIAMVFQEPMASLSPMHTIGDQIVEAIRLHQPVSKKEARQRGIEQLRRVGIPRPEDRMDAYSFQLSGGMCQRAMIAIALACQPALLIADEPTTALDVTTQARILDLLLELKEDLAMSMLFITHDLGVVAEVADDVAVMYLGKVVEFGPVDQIFHQPAHPYTRALLRSIPTFGLDRGHRLEAIPGLVPHPGRRPRGCSYHPRCDVAIAGLCEQTAPVTTPLDDRATVQCHLYENDGGSTGRRATEAAGPKAAAR
ncbi:ABC transporter ATP-binding protein [Microlunatus sp. GCM10028923]|uniref:ABC transporter ATP-binding protein n=1 Tax=Microlunatus sp. GCM10028923 TaxID=3273400 RepID=UPI003615E928